MSALLQVQATAATEAGASDLSNADAVAWRFPDSPAERIDRGSIWVIADGLGSQAAAATSSKLAADAVIDHYWHSAIPEPAGRLMAAVQHANGVLVDEGLRAGSRSACRATVLAGVIFDNHLYVAHAGRSRAYLLRDGRLRALTQDHSWVAEQVRAGRLAPEQATTHRLRNVITRCLGAEARLEIDIAAEPLQAGDLILLCSDGLYRRLAEPDIHGLLARHGPDAARELVDSARRLPGSDDVTAVTVGLAPSGLDQLSVGDRLALLNRLGRELSRNQDLHSTLSMIVEQTLRLCGGDRAAALLPDEQGRLLPVATYQIERDSEALVFSGRIAAAAMRERRPVLVNDALGDPDFGQAQSIIAARLRSVLCVPIIGQDETLGVLYVDSTHATNAFGPTDLDLLVSFSNFAAIAIQNARLHDALLARTRELEVARARQESLFRSINSAILAVDAQGIVTDWNTAASTIFGVSAEQALGRPLRAALPAGVASWLAGLIAEAETDQRTILTGHEWEGALGRIPRVVLAGRVARLRDEHDRERGYVFVINDRTDLVLVEEARAAERLERERLRHVLGTYLAPPVVEEILRHGDSVGLGGDRRDITIMFADLRGFTGLSERLAPEEVVGVLNRYLTAASEQVFAELGTVDKFLGDGIMAIFGAPVLLPDHAMAAIRAARAMVGRLEELRQSTGVPVRFGIGINSGSAIVGNIGSSQFMSYTAIGDVVNVAARLQSEARSGEILISEATLDRVREQVQVEELGPLYVKGRSVPVPTFRIRDVTC